MTEESVKFDRKLYKAIGYNAKLAREIAGLDRKEAMRLIWAYRNDKMFANRVSELESGDKKIELKTVVKLCEVYGCSADFILGFSDEFERNNLAAKYSGMVFQSIRGSVLEATEQLCMNVSKSINHLPPFQGELLKNSSKQLSEVIKKHSHDLAFRGEYPDILDAARDLEQKVAMFEMFFAKQMRQMELSMMNLLDQGTEADEMSSMKLTHDINFKKPVNSDDIDHAELNKPKKVPEVNVWPKIRKYYESEIEPNYLKIKADLCAEFELKSFPLERTIQRRLEKEEWSIPKAEVAVIAIPEEKMQPGSMKKVKSYDDSLWLKIRQYYESEQLSYEQLKNRVCKAHSIVEFPAPRTLRRHAAKWEWKKYDNDQNAIMS